MVHPWNQSAWTALRGLLERLPNALLLCGPRGIGKLALARQFAQRILCEIARADEDSCGRCDGCRWFAAATHPDFRFLQPEALAALETPAGSDPDSGEEKPASAQKRAKPSTEIKIEQVRGLSDFLNIGSHRGRRRVVLLHPAEAMNLNAANALLKALEEPSPNAAFILVSHRASQLLPTVRSRCVVMNLGTPDAALAAGWLAAQGVKAAERWIRYCGGAPLLALEHAQAGRFPGLVTLLSADPESRDRHLGALRDRQELGVLLDALQKIALDRALVSAGQAPKYLPGARVSAGDAGHWVAVARKLGRYRTETDHPLQINLFIKEILTVFT